MLSSLLKNLLHSKPKATVVSARRPHDTTALPYPHDVMLENFQAALPHFIQHHKSRHWDRFGENYSFLIADVSRWDNFRRSGITAGYDSDESGTPISTEELANEEYVLLPEHSENRDVIDKLLGMYESLTLLAGREFMERAYVADVGSPSHHLHGGTKLNEVDLCHSYNAWQIHRFIQYKNIDSPVIVEIGGGYGGLAAQLKRLYPNALVIILDLPEVNSTQTYYLIKSFPDSKVFLYKDYLSGGIERLYSGQYDFAVLPGWVMEEIKDKSVDVFTNIRSMMEMNIETINYYFEHIQRCVNNDGAFYCVNRYSKATVGTDVMIKNYPFDEYWHMVLSQTCWGMEHIHELLLQRKSTPSGFPVSIALKSLRPWMPPSR